MLLIVYQMYITLDYEDAHAFSPSLSLCYTAILWYYYSSKLMLEPNFPYKCPFNCSIARSTLVNSSLFSSIDFVSFSILVCNISSAFNFSVSKKHSPKTRSHFESSSAKVISDSASSVSSNCFCLKCEYKSQH